MNRYKPNAAALRALVSGAALLCCATVPAVAGDKISAEKAVAVVAKAACGAGDHPETALQGQVPAYLRASGFHGFNCNLELVGQSRGDGANWQSAEFKDRAGHTCAYHGTSLSTAGRTHVGVPVVDITNASSPVPTSYLTTTSMLDPWESLKVNDRRQLLAADNGHNGGGGPEVDIYDISLDCRSPQLLSTIPVGNGADGGVAAPAPVVGHEGSWAPDGMTYYIGDTTNRSYEAVDVTEPTKPRHIATFDMKTIGLASHGLSISDDGNRAYVVTPGIPTNLSDLTNPAVAPTNGFVILDTSEIQARRPNPQFHVISKFLFKDGSVAQHTIPVKIAGKPYIIHVDEGGSGGLSSVAQAQAACAAGMPIFPLARIVDVSDEANPTLVSRLALEIHSPKSCPIVVPDLVGLSIFTYGSHYCSVDNKQNATTLACGYFNSGVRVFDIRNPASPKEIAYYNPAGVTTASPGSNHTIANNFVPGGPDWCSAQVHLDASRGTIWTTCQDNGVLVMRFTHNVWPFPESSTPPGQQN
jgi:LVIVD repeat-containing protein